MFLTACSSHSGVSNILVGNFDRNVETASGSGSVHTTPGVAFQEGGDDTVRRNEDVRIPKSKKRSIQLTRETDNPHETTQPKKSQRYLRKWISRRQLLTLMKCVPSFWLSGTR